MSLQQERIICEVVPPAENVTRVASCYSRTGDPFHLVLRYRVSSTSTVLNPAGSTEFVDIFFFVTSSGVNRLNSADPADFSLPG